MNELTIVPQNARECIKQTKQSQKYDFYFVGAEKFNGGAASSGAWPEPGRLIVNNEFNPSVFH